MVQYNESSYSLSNSSTYDTTFLTQLEKAVNGEYSAIACYDRIIQMAPSQDIRQRVEEIRKDEIRHYNTFQHLYHSITGNPLTPHVTESCPTQYVDALQFAFKDEQKTVDFYNDFGYTINDSDTREAFLRAAKDEQNHAVWFLYLIGLRRF